MSADTAADLAAMDTAKRLREKALAHKRKSRREQALAREAMTDLARFCASAGISFDEVCAK